KHPKLQQLLDSEERLGTGIYKPFLDDPELCNPYATNLWELCLHTQSYHPTVRTLAKHVARTITTGTADAGYRTLPADLNLAPLTYLRKFDPVVGYPKRDFKLVPAVNIPAAVSASLKRKREKGISKALGPFVLDDSDFLKEVKEDLEGCEEELEGLESVLDGEGEEGEEEQEELERLVRKEAKLRKMVELMRDATSNLLDEDISDEDEDEGGEEEQDIEDEEGEDDMSGFPMFPGMKMDGAQRAMRLMASKGLLGNSKLGRR
ncbi:hypothetical protein HDV05_007364, partial [Chytridiales sp. JEL 0842]